MYACIDLGSNSFHLLIGEWEAGRIQIVERCSEKVQLGEDVGRSGVIAPQAMQRGLQCLQHFKTLMDGYPLQHYWALGTNTFRVAENAAEFIAAANEIGIQISTISGVQEAVLIYAGVITSLPESDAQRLVIDIGGGSTEVIIGRAQQRLLTNSLAIGGVAWRDRFFGDPAASSEELERSMELAVVAAEDVFSAIAPGIGKIGWAEVYASSGTVKMLASICEAHGFGRGQIGQEALFSLKSAFASCIAESSELAGMKERRRDLLLAGWSILLGLMRSYHIACIDFSATALREGMLDFMVKNQKTAGIMANSALPAIKSVSN
jgi:exopolyphosphatase/guanosine-5'-triphosphate,3'-diphosphate pyrophosphatase